MAEFDFSRRLRLLAFPMRTGGMAVKAQTMCFPRGKTKFIRPDGSIGRAPGHGVVLAAAVFTAC